VLAVAVHIYCDDDDAAAGRWTGGWRIVPRARLAPLFAGVNEQKQD